MEDFDADFLVFVFFNKEHGALRVKRPPRDVNTVPFRALEQTGIICHYNLCGFGICRIVPEHPINIECVSGLYRLGHRF